MDSKQHFFKVTIASHFFVPSNLNVQILKCELFSGSLFYYVRWSDDLRDVTFLDKDNISVIVDCMSFAFGESSHSFFSWHRILEDITYETDNISSKQKE